MRIGGKCHSPKSARLPGSFRLQVKVLPRSPYKKRIEMKNILEIIKEFFEPTKNVNFWIVVLILTIVWMSINMVVYGEL